MCEESCLPPASPACMLHSQGPLSLWKDQSTWGRACSLADMGGCSALPGRRPGTGELCLYSTLLFNASTLILASSLTSSSRSRFTFLSLLDSSATKFRKRDELSWISTRIIASDPYTKLKGVSLVVDWGVVVVSPHNSRNLLCPGSFGLLEPSLQTSEQDSVGRLDLPIRLRVLDWCEHLLYSNFWA